MIRFVVQSGLWIAVGADGKVLGMFEEESGRPVRLPKAAADDFGDMRHEAERLLRCDEGAMPLETLLPALRDALVERMSRTSPESARLRPLARERIFFGLAGRLIRLMSADIPDFPRRARPREDDDSER